METDLDNIINNDSTTTEDKPTEIKNADNKPLLIKIEPSESSIKIRQTKEQFIIKIASDIYYSRDINVNTSNIIAKNAISLAKTFYNQLKNSQIIKEYIENGTIVVEY